MLQIFILLLLVYNGKSDETRGMCYAVDGSSTVRPPCGSYGFRCVDEQTYQICGTVDSEGNMESPEFSRECVKGLQCDEENPAYCTPIDEEMEAAKHANDLRITRHEREGSMYELFDNNGEEITSCYKSDDFEFTTPVPQVDDESTPSFVRGEYECPGYGQYADPANKSMYWICDSNSKGFGFEVHHMSCGKKRMFDPKLKECVTIGTTREIRSTALKQELLRICRINRKTHRFRLKRGDCQNYYLCYNYNQDVMKMQCPRYYQFSDRYSRCMPESLVDCDAQNKNDQSEEEDTGDYYVDD